MMRRAMILILLASLVNSVQAMDKTSKEKARATALVPPVEPLVQPKNLPKVTKAVLKNGMTVLVLERHNSPTVAFNVYFRVGSVNDVPGKTGLAHLFEHMIFKGTKTLNTKNYRKERKVLDKIEEVAQALILEEAVRPPDAKKVKTLREKLRTLQKEADEYLVPEEYEKLYTRHGGSKFNASTASDYTNYILSLPSNKVDLWLIVEADRFRNPVLREFYKERSVVMEERRMRYESNPDGMLWEAFVSLAFQAHPYRDLGIGWMSDLQHISRTDAQEFFDMYYGPQNAVVGVVGDVDAKKFHASFKRKFEGLPARSAPPDLLTVEPPQRGERRAIVRYEAQPQFIIGYKKPDIHHPDQPVLIMTSSILSGGRTSRFYKKLVEGKKLAVQVASYTRWPGVRYPGLFLIEGVPRSPATPEQLEAAVYEELEILKKEGPTDWEMEKVRNSYEAGMVREMQSNENMANKLAYNEAVVGDWRHPWQILERLKRVSADDVKRVAQGLFVAKKRSVATLKPPVEEEEK